MTRPTVIFMLVCIVPTCAIPGYISASFAVPLPDDDEKDREPETPGNEQEQTGDQPAERPAPGPCPTLGLALNEQGGRLERTPLVEKTSLRPFEGGAVRRVDKWSAPLERVVAAARCVARTLSVLALPIKSNAPPSTA